jgi:hypothetical protein
MVGICPNPSNYKDESTMDIKSWVDNHLLLTVSGDTLQGADLSQANLSWANLSGANLSETNLTRANLSRAYLSEADLSWANLSKANLTCADLTRADLTGTILPNGMTLPQYIEWLPSGLLTQGGKTLEEVAASWGNHTWTDCPMATAFSVGSLQEIPECHRQGAALFIALYDGEHLPKPI